LLRRRDGARSARAPSRSSPSCRIHLLRCRRLIPMQALVASDAALSGGSGGATCTVAPHRPDCRSSSRIASRYRTLPPPGTSFSRSQRAASYCADLCASGHHGACDDAPPWPRGASAPPRRPPRGRGWPGCWRPLQPRSDAVWCLRAAPVPADQTGRCPQFRSIPTRGESAVHNPISDTVARTTQSVTRDAAVSRKPRCRRPHFWAIVAPGGEGTPGA